MTWEETAAKEGRLYCQRRDTWCALIDMNNGSCSRGTCILEVSECTTAKEKAFSAPASIMKQENVLQPGAV